jgi:hypothetical protein
MQMRRQRIALHVYIYHRVESEHCDYSIATSSAASVIKWVPLRLQDCGARLPIATSTPATTTTIRSKSRLPWQQLGFSTS